MKKIDFHEELHKFFWPQVEYLIENCKNPNKYNSNCDRCQENIRLLESLKSQLDGYIRDFSNIKKIIDKTNQQTNEQDELQFDFKK